MRYDIAIIGAGPAGVSAALNAKALGKSFCLFGKSPYSEKVLRSEQIGNYPGFAEITGQELVDRFQEQLDAREISVCEEQITGIFPMGGYFGILANQTSYEASTVILATGVETRKQISGELAFLGRGVSYCATCDGNLYREKTIAVVCETRELEHEAEFLGGIAKKMYYFPLFQESGIQSSDAGIEVCKGLPVAVEGEQSVEKLVLKDGTVLEVDGVFFLKQSVSPAALLRGLPMEDGHIAVGRDMATGIEGCFAAGDCTGRPYQIAKATGEGNIAVHSAVAYLHQKERHGR